MEDMINEDDRVILQPIISWCESHPGHNLTPAVLEVAYGIPQATTRSWAGKSLPEKNDEGHAWPTEGMPGWLMVFGGPLATNIRSNRTKRSIRETRNSL